MMRCSNCEGVASPKDALVVAQALHTVAVICAKCQDPVVTAKIVLTRKHAHNVWGYEGYLPAATEK